ncbi:MAG: hypothetical protein H0Z39_02775 [Peptococcaceae bacterium]|nr:hypothetical protein [Peptococcaceae bacterium]
MDTCAKKRRFDNAVEISYLQQGEVPGPDARFNTCDGSILMWTNRFGISAEKCGDYAPNKHNVSSC